MSHKSILLTGAALLTIGVATPSLAQETSTTQSSKTKIDDESGNQIIVTARLVRETLQDVPEAITAFSGQQLQSRSMTSLQDIALQTPGFNYEDYSNGGYGVPTIRGASQFSITNLEQNVSVFIDGIYVPRQYSFDVGTMTLQRVEIVKGPQSALYGANAFAGAINYLTTDRSTSNWEGHAEIGLSENDGFDIGGKINAPIIPDKVSLRAAGFKSKFGGDIPNSHPNANVGIYPGTNGNFGGYSNDAYQVGGTIKPVEALTADFDYYHFDINDEVHAGYRIDSRYAGNTNCGALNGAHLNKLFCGPIPTTPVDPLLGPGYLQDPRSSGITAATDLYRAAAELRLTDTVSLSYLFGEIDGNVFAGGDSDQYPLTGNAFFGGDVFSFGPTGHYKYQSHEARLQYQNTSGLYAMIGGYAQDGTDFDYFAAGVVPLAGTVPINSVQGLIIGIPAQTHSNIRAVYGRLAIPLIDKKLNISVEGRYTREKKDSNDGSAGAPYHYYDNYFTPRFEVDYKITPNNMVFASFGKGVKSGGVNSSSYAGLLPAERFYGPDTNWTYEIGFKNTFSNGKGFFNADVFYIDWTNLQFPQAPTGAPYNTAQITVNLSGATSKGIEVSGQYELIKNFKIDASLAYIDAKYKNGVISGRILYAGACDNIACNSNGDVSGNKIQRESPWQWNVGAEYRAPISDSYNVFGRVDIFGQSRQYTDETNTAYIPSRTLVNARLGIKGDRWTFAVWGKNILDKTYAANAFATITPFATTYVPSIGNKRRIGATLSYDF